MERLLHASPISCGKLLNAFTAQEFIARLHLAAMPKWTHEISCLDELYFQNERRFYYIIMHNIVIAFIFNQFSPLGVKYKIIHGFVCITGKERKIGVSAKNNWTNVNLLSHD